MSHRRNRIDIQNPHDPILQELAKNNLWYIWILEYGITHNRMIIAVHTGGYLGFTKIVLLDCIRFCGLLKGGPYELILSEIDYENEKLLEIRSLDNSFQIIFEDAFIVK